MKHILDHNPLSYIIMSYNRWIDNAIGLKWFTKVFVPKTIPLVEGRWRLMLFNRHLFYITSKVICIYIANKIILLCLPLHSIHLLQPLDISLFGPLVSFYKSIIRATYKFGYIFSINKLVFLDLYLKAYEKAFIMKNIESSWMKVGLLPFNPPLVIDALLKPVILISEIVST